MLRPTSSCPKENTPHGAHLLLEFTDAYVLSVAALTIGRRRADAETTPDA